MNDLNQWLRHADAAPADADSLDAQIAASPARMRLHALRHDLQPLSAQLSDDLAHLFASAHDAHRHARPSRRATHAPRRWSALAAVAASLIAVVAVWGLRHERAATPPATAAVATPPDRIFAGLDDKNVAPGDRHAHDEIFRGNFLPDEIFNSSRQHEG